MNSERIERLIKEYQTASNESTNTLDKIKYEFIVQELTAEHSALKDVLNEPSIDQDTVLDYLDEHTNNLGFTQLAKDTLFYDDDDLFDWVVNNRENKIIDWVKEHCDIEDLIDVNWR